MSQVPKIISGGQTGADRTALDWALSHGIPCNGWCPKGRKAEDGIIDARYPLRETPSDSYLQRTEWNVRDSDATIVFSINPVLSGGSKKTLEFAHKHNKPCLHLHAGMADAGERLRSFVHLGEIHVLNVAGPRASKEPTLAEFVTAALDGAFGEEVKR